MWSLYVGRPVAIDDKHITAQPPASTDENASEKFWQPYIDETNAYNPIRLRNPIEDVSKYTAELCAQMTRVRDHLYASGSCVHPAHAYSYMQIPRHASRLQRADYASSICGTTAKATSNVV